jgi:hypothetical protein
MEIVAAVRRFPPTNSSPFYLVVNYLTSARSGRDNASRALKVSPPQAERHSSRRRDSMHCHLGIVLCHHQY